MKGYGLKQDGDKMKQEISFKLKKALTLSKGNDDNGNLVVALMAEVAQFGYKFSLPLINILKTQSKEDISAIRNFLITHLSKTHPRNLPEPLFRKFPHDVPEENTYLLKRILGFIDNFLEKEDGVKLSCGCVVDETLFDVQLFGACPICQRQTDLELKRIPRTELRQKTLNKVINLITEEDFTSLIKNIFAQKSRFTELQKDVIPTIFDLYKKDIEKFFSSFDIKENWAFTAAEAFKHGITLKPKTVTDVLRLAVVFSGESPNLASPVRYQLLGKQRKHIINLLNNIEETLADMNIHKEKWLHLGKYLHIGCSKYATKRTKDNFNALRNTKIIGLSHKIQSLIDTRDWDGLLFVLSDNPGILLRHLDLLLRNGDKNKTLKIFGKVINKNTTKALLKLYKFMDTRGEKESLRYFVPNGDITSIFVSEDNRKPLPKETISKVKSLIKTELLSRFKSSSDFSKTYIDEDLKKILTPLSVRNTGENTQTLELGSRVQVGDSNTKFYRLFSYWKNNSVDEHIDVDLSAIAFGEDFKMRDYLSWTKLKGLGGVHSGDITSAPNGASEFIDIDAKKMLGDGIRYLAVKVISYTGQRFGSFECFSGVMARDNASGEIYEPKTVKTRFDVIGNATEVLPLVLDIKTGEMLWVNAAKNNSKFTRAEAKSKTLSYILRASLEAPKYTPSLYELFSLHVEANGGEIVSRDEANTVFDMERASDIADILANWI